MKKSSNKIKYFLYARKSTESEDKQVASIEAQVSELKKLAKQENLRVVEILSESRSAKSPGRPVFDKMMERINTGEAQGILCWKLNRLARNPIDGGQISWVLQEGVVQHIQTYGRSYYPNDNVIMMAVELGMANQFVRDLSVDTKRGLRIKAEKGWFPGRAPLGYLNNKFREKGKKDIIKDPENFPLVRKMWDMLLDKQYPLQRIYTIATEEWGLRYPNGKKPCLSKTYELFVNPFYYGHFRYGGNLHKGNHEPMITEAEFNDAQVILGLRSKPRAQTHEFAFTGLIRCGECGASITAEKKVKRQKNGNVHHYTYYRCTKRLGPCSQKCLREKDLRKQIHRILEEIEIPHEFYEWGLDVIRGENEKESESRNAVLAAQQKNYEQCVRKLDSLIDMRAAGEITTEEFSKKRSELTEEKDRLQKLLNDTDSRITNWVEYAEQAFKFAESARTRFEIGSLDTRREILSKLGSNLVLKDKILSVNVDKPLLVIREAAKEVRAIHRRLEPLEKPLDKEELQASYARNPVLGGRGDSNSP